LKCRKHEIVLDIVQIRSKVSWSVWRWGIVTWKGKI